MRLELSRRAQVDLDDIRDYGVERFGAARTDAYLGAIEQAFRLMLDHPRIGTARSGLYVRLRSLPSGEHRIYYSLDGDRIFIEHILHTAMDVGRHL